MDPQLKAALIQAGIVVLQNLLPLVGTLLGSLLSYLIYLAISHVKNQQLQNELQMAVSYAEQRFVNSPDKLAYVSSWIKQRTGGKIDDTTLNHMLENAVVALNNSQVPASSTSPNAS